MAEQSVDMTSWANAIVARLAQGDLCQQLEGSEASAAELRQEKGVLASKITSLEEMLASLQSKLAAEK